jgi:hypothetical protein
VDEAKAVLRSAAPNAAPGEVNRLTATVTAAHATAAGNGSLFGPALPLPVLLAFLIACLNQLSGINAVPPFASRIFEIADIGEKSALLQSVEIGIMDLVFTRVGLWLIDRAGRRTLLAIGSVGYILSLGLTA